jgi:pyruvate ferredoxin oxidoreductase alpha subunit
VANAALEQGVAPAPRLLYTANEMREVRKLQAVAAAERRETGTGK